MRPIRTVILGASGQLGTDLRDALSGPGFHTRPLTHGDVDIRDRARMAEVLDAARPDVVVNLTALHNVEACEVHPEAAFEVNCHAVHHLAQVCDRLDARLVHISTDYVFGGDGRMPYREDAALNPVNAYGVSKAAGEYFVRQECRRHLVIRTAGLYGVAGASGKGGNFVETMIRLGRERGAVSVVTDQVLSPTYTVDLAESMRELIEGDAQGVFHVTNRGSCSWYEFARVIFELAGIDAQVHPTTSVEFGATVARPAYSALDLHRLRAQGFTVPRPWDEAVLAYLESREGQEAWADARRIAA